MERAVYRCLPLVLLVSVVLSPLTSDFRGVVASPDRHTAPGLSDAPLPSEANAAAIAPAQASADWGKLPLAFVANAGQSDQQVKYQAHDPHGGVMFFTPGEIVFSLPPPPDAAPEEEDGARPEPRAADRERGPKARPIVVRLRFEGATRTPSLAGEERLPGVANYLAGADQKAWRTNVATYGSIVYQALYPGIDLRYAGQDGQLKGTYTVAPGSDPSLIRWRYQNTTAANVDDAGNLVVTLPARKTRGKHGEVLQPPTLIETAPIAWQDHTGTRVAVTVRYTIHPDGTYGFTLGAYDQTQPLTIDPTLTYSTYLGGSGLDEGHSIAVDGSGNAYIAGATRAANFPVVNAVDTTLQNFDAFITKLNAQGTALLYSTYLGGSGDDFGYGIDVDSTGHAYVTGITTSGNFPTLNAAQLAHGGSWDDAFITKLSPTGTALVYSTYIGGNGEDRGLSIAVDGSDNAYITGSTRSTNLPLVNPLQTAKGDTGNGLDAFVVKLNATGNTRLYATYLGGSVDDAGHGIAVDATGHAYVTGETYSANFRIQSPLQASNGGNADAIVSKLTAQGNALVYSTYLGGSARDIGYGIAIDTAGSAYVTGITGGAFRLASPLRGTAEGDEAFVSKLNALGTGLVYSTYVGGNGGDFGYGIAVDSGGSAYVTGATQSTIFQLQSAFQATNRGGADGFVTKVTAAGDGLGYSTFLGGSGDDQSFGIAVDSSGNAYVTGGTTSVNFPTLTPVQATNQGSTDAFITKLTVAGSTLGYSTYLGGSGQDEGHSIAVDGSGNAYLAGTTRAANFPVVNALDTTLQNFDAFITKLNAQGTALLYSTYLGGSRQDFGYGIDVDSSGHAYVTGITTSDDFPTLNAAQPAHGGSHDDAFITKLNPNGNGLIYSTYIGGNGEDRGLSIAVDGSDNAYITGSTRSTNLPLVNPLQTAKGDTENGKDAFVVKLNATGNTRLYATYLGGSADDAGNGIAVDATGNSYVTGQTYSVNFPTQAPLQAGKGPDFADAFVTKITPQGNALVYSTFLGGSRGDSGASIALDTAGNAYVTGITGSSNFPLLNAVQATTEGSGGNSAFVSKVNAAGSAFVYSTYLGGSSEDFGYGIAVDRAGNAYVTGTTSSVDFPTRNPVQAANGGLWDVFVVNLNAQGTARVYATYLGGSGDDHGYAIAVDSAGTAYVTGSTASSNFPTRGAWQGSSGGGQDAFVAKLVETVPPTVPPNLRVTGNTRTTIGLAWDAARDNVGVTGYNIYRGQALVRTTTGTTYTDTGLTPATSYTYTVKAKDAAGNLSPPSNAVTTTTLEGQPPTAPPNVRVVSKNDTMVRLTWDPATDNVGVTDYVIYMGTTELGTSSSTTAFATNLTPNTSYTFTVKARDAAGNISPASNAVTVTTDPAAPPTPTPGPYPGPSSGGSAPAAAQPAVESRRATLPFVSTPRPPTTISYYVDTGETGRLKELGKMAGIRDHDLPGPQQSLVILHFGRPDDNRQGLPALTGTRLFNDTHASMDTIRDLARAFVDGYLEGVHTETADTTSQLLLVIGTSNYGESGRLINRASGVEWAKIVRQVFIDQSGRGPNQVAVAGGMDLEVGWQGRTRTRDFANGYSESTVIPLYNFGDAAGCPPDEGKVTSFTAYCSNGWYQADVYDVSTPYTIPNTSQVRQRFAVPQIYFETQDQQWYELSRHGVYSRTPEGKPVDLQGVLTTVRGCRDFPATRGCVDRNGSLATNFPGIAFSRIVGEHIQDPKVFQVPPYSTDIDWPSAGE